MGIKRIVDVGFWTDGKVDEFSPEDKYFMLYLLTNPFTTQLGIYEISIKQAAFQLGYTVDTVNVLLDRFETKYNMIIYSRSTREIAIKNFLRHSIIKGGKPVEDCIKKEIAKVKNKRLIASVFDYIASKDDLNETVKKIINEYEINNDNDNDNDVSYHDSYNDSLNEPEPPAKPKKEKPVKHKHGEYNNVLLTDEELQKLKTEYSDYEKRIENLSSYIASTGKSYKSHYATIRNWARKDAEKPGRKEIVPDWMEKKNKFNNFEGRNYSPGAMDDLTRALIAQPPELSEEYQERVRRLKEEGIGKG
jgi:hypothetical protein